MSKHSGVFSSWLRENFSKKSTRRTYRDSAKRFAKFLYPEEKIKTVGDIDKYLEEYLKNDPDFVSDFKRFIKAMQDDGLAPKTENKHARLVKEFVEEVGGIKIEEGEWRKIRRRLLRKPVVATEKGYLKKNQLREVLTHLTAKGLSLFLFLLSSGCRIGEALKLKVEDLHLDEDPPRAQIRPETKSEEGRVVFFSYEARNAIKQWLKRRKDLKKRGTSETYDQERVWPISQENARRMWNSALEIPGHGRKDPDTGLRVYHVHTTRKFFRNEFSGDPDTRGTLMGHRGYMDVFYRHNTEEDLAENYRLAMPSVTIFRDEPEDDGGKLNRNSLNTIIDVLKALGVSSEEIGRAVAATEYGSKVDNYREFERFGDPIPENHYEELRGELLSLIEKNRNSPTTPKQRFVTPEEAEELVEAGGWRFLEGLSNGKVVVEEVG